jgi:hypothetical protein
MKKLSFLIVFISFSFLAIAQNSNLKDECFSSNVSNTNSVKEFKDNLKLTIEAKKLTIGKTTHSINFLHSEIIQSESTLIQFNDTIAAKISVVRAVDYKNKKYLYKLDLFEKKDNCWRPKNTYNFYNEFHLGTISSGQGSGVEGSIDYLFFSGTFKIE